MRMAFGFKALGLILLVLKLCEVSLMAKGLPPSRVQGYISASEAEQSLDPYANVEITFSNERCFVENGNIIKLNTA
jgi:hypothetical protein